MVRTVFVIIHVAAGVSGLVLGLAVIRPRLNAGDLARKVYLVLIGLLFGSLLGLIALDWSTLEVGARIAFVALAGLAAVMLLRVWRALAEVAAVAPGWQDRYIDHVFFSYISLWVGFLVLPALNLPYPAVTVPAVALSVVGLGLIALARYKRRVLKGSAVGR